MPNEKGLPLFDQPVLKVVREEITMSSAEIADLVNSRHDSVKRAIERLADRGVITLPPMVEVSNLGLGPKTIAVYQIGKRDSYVIVAQLSPEFTARLVDRWQELEEQVSKAPVPDLNDPHYLRSLLLSYSEERIALEHKIEEQRPKVEALDRLSELQGNMCITDAAKNLKASPSQLFRWMDTNGWTYRRGGRGDRVAYQSKVTAGYLEHRPIDRRNSNGEEFVITQVMVTAKGLTYLAQIFPPAARDVK